MGEYKENLQAENRMTHNCRRDWMTNKVTIRLLVNLQQEYDQGENCIARVKITNDAKSVF